METFSIPNLELQILMLLFLLIIGVQWSITLVLTFMIDN